MADKRFVASAKQSRGCCTYQRRELESEEERVDGWKKGSSTKGRNQEEKERVDGLEDEREGIRSLGEEERRRWQWVEISVVV